MLPNKLGRDDEFQEVNAPSPRMKSPAKRMADATERSDGFGARVRSLLGFFRPRRVPPRRRDWPMELASLGGRIPAIVTEPTNLGRRPPRRAERGVTLRPKPQAGPPAQSAREPPTLRREPSVDADCRPFAPPLQSADRHWAGGGRVAAREDTLGAYGLDKSFTGRKVVNNVTIRLHRGEAVGLLGPNGAGKTTVFYMISGLIKADRGHIELDGHDVTGLPMYQRARLGVGYLPQEASIFRGLNVEDNIRSVLEMIEPNRRRREAALTVLLEEFGIARHRKTPAIALSGGERRRVEIARALASRPSYMLLDEPFAGIDPKAVVEIQKLVRHLTGRGIGVLITDHNVRETLDLTDRSYIIYAGEVLMEGDKAAVVNDPEVRRLYLGEEFRIV